MTDYVAVPVTTEPDDLLTTIFDFVQERIPGWEPNEGNLEVILAEAFAEVMAEIRDLASDMPTALFRYFGANIANLPPVDATRATASTTWTAVDSAGYTIPGGTIITLLGLDGSPVGFSVDTDTNIPAASTTANVNVTAIEAGASGSGLSGIATLVDALDFISGVTVVGVSVNGNDPEDDSAYLARLVDELRLQSPRPILPDDFSVLASTVTGVSRAVAIDNYKADTSTAGVDGAITVAVVDSTGEAVSSAAKAAVTTLLTGDQRVLNLAVYVVDPTSNTIDVGYDVAVLPGYAAADVKARVDSAIATFLSPANWGLTPGLGQRPAWVNTTTVRRLALAQAILNVDGVAYFNSGPTLCLHGGTLATSDVALTGVAPLTRSGTITGVAS